MTELLAGQPVDVVLSYMATHLSGIESSDAARVSHLVELAMDFAVRHLRPDGALEHVAQNSSGASGVRADASV